MAVTTYDDAPWPPYDDTAADMAVTDIALDTAELHEVNRLRILVESGAMSAAAARDVRLRNRRN